MAEQWILDLSRELQEEQNPPVQEPFSKSIYRVPKILTDINSQAYKPKLASFGPYHHNRRHLRPMEQHKHRGLKQFLRRIAKASKTLDDVLIAMRRVLPNLIASYDALQVEDDDEDFLERGGFRGFNWVRETDKFLKLMIVDGCFALEIMLSHKRSAAKVHSEYDPHDPVFGAVRMIYVVADLRQDMLLVENQLPLLALTTLAAIDGSGIKDVKTLIKDFYGLSSNSREDQRISEGLNVPAEQSFHILDLYRKILTSEGEYLPSSEENVPSAIELKNAGVSSILMTPLSQNCPISWERLHATADNEVTAYIFFMDWLINTVNDVALLRTKEIIKGCVGSDENISNMFNKIAKEATLAVFKDDIQVDEDVNRRLNIYCKKRMHRWRANFVETYLKNPWVFISLLGGLLLLVLTIIQTMYTMLQYYNP